MKKNFFSIFALLSVFLITGCNNLVDKENFSAEDKATISVKRVINGSSERSVYPSFEETELADYSFTLTGTKDGSETNFGTFENLSLLTSASFVLEAGNWTFQLTAEKNGTKLKGLINQKIIVGDNTLSFSLSWDKNNLSGKGNLSFEFDFSQAETAATVMLVTGELVKYDPATAEETSIEQYKETELSVNENQLVYSLTDVDAGYYRIKIHLYADTEKKNPINTWRELVTITGGKTSHAKRSMTDLNQIYSIEYEWNDGTLSEGQTLPEIYTRQTVAFTLPELTKDHYDFEGWYKTSDFSGDAVTSIDGSSTGKLKFFAKFSPKKYSVSYNKNSEKSGGTMETQLFTYGEQQPVYENAFTVPTGYEFTNWNTEPDGSGTSYGIKVPVTFVEDTILYAIWTPIEYTIDYVLNGTDSKPANNASTNPSGFTVEDLPVTFENPTRTGYAFCGWYTDENFAEGTKISQIDSIPAEGNDSISVYASWSSSSISVTVSNQNDLILSHEEDGNSINFTVVDRDGTFAWKVDGVSVSETGKTFVLDTSSLNEGTYVVQVISDDGLSASACVDVFNLLTEFYVMQDGDDTNEGRANSPIATLSNVFKRISDAADGDSSYADKDYIIYIDGTLRGAQTIPSSVDDKARSITLRGKNPLVEGLPQDALNNSADPDNPTTLSIETTVPVIIENLKITGGHPGLRAEVNVDVTLGSGALVTENIGSSGVCIEGGKVTLEGGVISNNTVEEDAGAGVCVTGGEFIMKSGTISRNDATGSYSGGGGLAVLGGTFTLKGGTISGNGAGDHCGGAIYLGETSDGEVGVLNIEGGTIIGNSASQGGGLYVYASSVENPENPDEPYRPITITMNAGSIEGNRSKAGGGGVYIYTDEDRGKVTFNMSGGIITENIDESNDSNFDGGGGVNIIGKNTVFAMSGSATIYGNRTAETAEGGGNGVIVYSGAKLMMSDAATIPSDNDVVLEMGNETNSVITICGELTGEIPVATITASKNNSPMGYEDNREVLVIGDGVDQSAMENEYHKFALNPQDVNDVLTYWMITETGHLSKKTTISSEDELRACASVLRNGKSMELDVTDSIQVFNDFAVPSGATLKLNRTDSTIAKTLPIIQPADNKVIGSETSGRLILDGKEIACSSALAGYAGGVYYNVTFQNNYNTATSSSDYAGRGGAVYGGSTNNLRMYNCTITNCKASYGGALYILGDSQDEGKIPDGLVNVTIDNCSATNQGGGIYCKAESISHTVKLTDCTISNCVANDSGSKIYAQGTDVATCHLYINGELHDVAGDPFIKDNPVTKTISEAEVGDIVLNDGTVVSSEAFEDDLKSSAVAVIFYVGTELNNDGDTGTTRILGVGLSNTYGEETKEYAWATEGANGYSKSIETIASDSNMYGQNCVTSTDQELELRGVINGSNNWTLLKNYLADSANGTSDDTGTSSNYPAWNWANNYGTNHGLSGTYASDWYMPSLAELVMLFRVKDTVKASLVTAGGKEIYDKDGQFSYWTSSEYISDPDSDADKAYFVGFNDYIGPEEKNTEFCVCAIRQFN